MHFPYYQPLEGLLVRMLCVKPTFGRSPCSHAMCKGSFLFAGVKTLDCILLSANSGYLVAIIQAYNPAT